MEPISKYFFDDSYRTAYKSMDYSDLESDNIDVIEHVAFDFYNLSAISDSESSFDGITINECDGRISLAYERLPFIPKSIAEKFATTTHTLDLSYNNIRDLSFLTNFEQLNTLILDKNINVDIKSLPYLPGLNILWLNNCNIIKLSEWIQQIQVSCPKLKQLSLLGNPGILSTFNGASILEHNDYRMYVLSRLPTLQYLDDSIITDSQRLRARDNFQLYLNINNGPPLLTTCSEKFERRQSIKRSSFRFRNSIRRKRSDISSDSS